jgi:hypothetical protein
MATLAGQRAQFTLEYRGRKIHGAGKEWFKANRDEIISIYHSVTKS